jgi:transcriptional regulator with PAS, ATPase and Fis domain
MSRVYAWSYRQDPRPFAPDVLDSPPTPAPEEWAFHNSRAMRAVEQMIDRVAPTDATVLVLGESGVGKALVARALHERSLRRAGPFVKVNCAALPLELLESELFGYERGAFTGAYRQHPGRFELANMGTIFLDEIGEMPLPLQAKLLHVLQDREFSRLGGRHDIRVDVRIIAATNKDPAALVERGLFRDDLYYRLNVMSIHVPPLRERPEEIPILIEHFLAEYARQYGRPHRAVSPATLERMLDHPWPGNVRELENFARRIVLLESEDWAMERFGTDRLASAGPPPELARDGGAPGAAAGDAQQVLTVGLKEIGRRAAATAEATTLREVLERVRWHRLEAARMLGVSYKTLLYKLKQHGLAVAACCWLALR